MANEFEELMKKLASEGIVACVGNCKVGTVEGVLATFDYKCFASLMWLRANHCSRRERTEADGATPLDALKAVVRKVNKHSLLGETAVKCKRTVCFHPHDHYRHSQTGELYCAVCAAKINHANPEVPNLIRFESPE